MVAGQDCQSRSFELSSDSTSIILFLDDPGPVKIHLRPANYTTSSVAIYGSWCLQRHKAGSLARGVLRSSDGPSGPLTASLSPHG